MKTLLVSLFMFVSSVFAQEDIFTLNLSRNLGEKLGTPVFADINGNGQKEMCSRVLNPQTGECWLVAWDLKFQREMGRIPHTDRESPLYPTDLDGNGKKELVTINYVVWGDKPGFVIFRWEGGRFTRTVYTTFYGDGGRVGDIDGDGRSEVILNHLPKGYTTSGGYGPAEIQVIAWNSFNFELKAQLSLPETHFIMHVGDLNGNGKDEITILRSGYIRPHLSIFGYTHNPELALLDEWEFSDTYNDNIVRLWGEILPGNKQRLIVPIAEQYWEGSDGVEEVKFYGFRLTRMGIVPEQTLLVFKEFQNLKHTLPLPLLLQPIFRRIDINGDGVAKVLQFEENGMIRFVNPISSINRGPR